MNSAENLYKPAFSHIYMEKAAAGYDRTQRILRHFPDAHLITVDSYKDLFYRPAQDFSAQQRSRCLILAVRRDNFVFPGAPVCQSFGNEHFYYTSCTMNCLYDCEYCYLKGMYPSGDLVVFVNTEEYFPHLDALLEKFPVYLCISYDTDLLAMEKLTGICRAWIDYAAGKENLTIELRTKAADPAIWEAPALPNVIYAFTISPQAAAAKYEHGAPAPGRRVACAAEGIRRGFPVRLCFDPMLCLPDWQTQYRSMLSRVQEEIDLTKVRDFSVGTFRISAGYLKRMRRTMPGSAAVQYPYTLENGVYGYEKKLSHEMEKLLADELSGLVGPEKIFTWDA